MDNPQFLYHYTDLESLILILKNRTIRLKSLDQLDDKEESSFENFRAAAKYIFVSSWTEEEKEYQRHAWRQNQTAAGSF